MSVEQAPSLPYSPPSSAIIYSSFGWRLRGCGRIYYGWHGMAVRWHGMNMIPIPTHPLPCFYGLTHPLMTVHINEMSVMTQRRANFFQMDLATKVQNMGNFKQQYGRILQCLTHKSHISTLESNSLKVIGRLLGHLLLNWTLNWNK